MQLQHCGTPCRQASEIQALYQLSKHHWRHIFFDHTTAHNTVSHLWYRLVGSSQALQFDWNRLNWLLSHWWTETVRKCHRCYRFYFHLGKAASPVCKVCDPLWFVPGILDILILILDHSQSVIRDFGHNENYAFKMIKILDYNLFLIILSFNGMTFFWWIAAILVLGDFPNFVDISHSFF